MEPNPNELNNLSDSVKLGILIHRMGTLESGMTSIGNKIDSMGTLYPTTIHVDLLLAPIRDKVKELEDKEKIRELEQTRSQAQLKLALTMAILSPLFSFFVVFLLEKP